MSPCSEAYRIRGVMPILPAPSAGGQDGNALGIMHLCANAATESRRVARRNRGRIGLLPRRRRLSPARRRWLRRRLSEKVTDTGTALGSDVMSTALEGYALLKVIGKRQGLTALRDSLGTRFVKRSRATEEKAA